MKRLSPLAALTEGLVAGLAGALAQEVFFALTKRLTPHAPEDVFTPPERLQHNETATQTVARRFVEDLAQRGPVVHPRLAGELVHYAFGSAWGGLYGIAAGSIPSLRTTKGGALFGLFVWAISDDFILPAFKLSAWPGKYPLDNHAYALAAHVVYGAATSASLNAVDRVTPSLVSAIAAALIVRRLPKPVRGPTARRLAARGVRGVLKAREIAPWMN
jgi:uncharacterized membrane protein YagU involved in acid resistance